MQHLPINKENLPEQFEISFGGPSYILRFDYSPEYDLFSVSSFLVTEESQTPLVLGERLILEKPLWSDMIPEVGIGPDIIPMDLAGLETRITWDNFGRSVFLYVDDDSLNVTAVRGGEDEI